MNFLSDGAAFESFRLEHVAELQNCFLTFKLKVQQMFRIKAL